MLCRVPGVTAPARTFAALAVVLTVSLAPQGSHLRAGPDRPRPAAVSGMVIRMAGTARRAPARPGFRMHALTIKGFSLAGTPDTGDLVQLFDVDDTTHIDPQAGSGVFDNGVVKYSVPSGHYFAIAEFGGSSRATLVTLRTTAADAAGGTVTETITSAYRTGR